MVDTHDQNQIGPPIAAAATDTQTTAGTIVAPTHDNERLDRVRGHIDTLAELVAAIRDIDDRSRTLERDRRVGRDTESPEVARIWQSALEPLAHYLSQSIQVGAGAKPIQLADAADQLAAWVATFRENAVGPGGHGLQDDDQRLAAFEQKVVDIDPSPEWIEQEGQRLLNRPELDPDTIHRTVAATQQSLSDDKERQTAIDDTLASLEAEWDASITPLDQQLGELRTALVAVTNDTAASGTLRSKAKEGLVAIDAIKLDEVVRKRVSLGDWVDKYRADRDFTSDQVRAHINQELRPALRQVQTAVEQVVHRFTPDRLRTDDQAATIRTTKLLLDAVDKLLGDTRTRYQTLIALRRTKLGQEPDDRFFGEMAKRVNTAITELGTLEADLLRTRNDVAETGSLDHTGLDRLRKRTADTLKHSADYATPSALEKLLVKQAALQAAKDRELAEAEEQRATQARQAAEQASHKERARQQQQAHEAAASVEKEQQAVVHAQQQALSQELADYLAQLQAVEQEQHRRTAVLESLIAAERTLLVADQQKLLENRTERRAMTATEAEAWLKTLTDTKHSLEQRQQHLDQLTKELLGIQTNPTTTTMTSLRQRIGQLAPHPVSPPPQGEPATSVHDAPVRISIGRHS